jgi:hypothetical protein
MAPEAARLVEAFEEMFRLPGSAVRFRLVDTADLHLFAVPSRVSDFPPPYKSNHSLCGPSNDPATRSVGCTMHA